MTTRINNQSLNVCTACRSRKVRCDGQRATCGTCKRLGFSCLYPDNQIASSVTDGPASPPPRRRGQNACTACRQRKIRCSNETPTCCRCKKKGIECVYLGRRSRHNYAGEAESASRSPPARSTEANRRGIERPHDLLSPSVSDLSPEAASHIDLAPSLTSRALKAFFNETSQVPVFSFLHRASIMEEHRAGTLDRALLLAIVGLGCLVLDFGPNVYGKGTKYIDAAQTLIVMDLDSPTITKIQALILVIQHRSFSRKFATVFMLMSLATRSALGLRLNYENPRLPFLAQESCRRAMWSLYMIDTILAAGYDDFSLLRESLFHIQLPCRDHNFQMDIPQDSVPLYEEAQDNYASIDDQSPAALVIRMLSLRQRVLHFTKTARAQQPPQISTAVTSFRLELDGYLERLPQSFKLSAYNFRLHVHMPTFIAYLKIHATWLGVNCILYRLVLGGLKESLPLHKIAALDAGFRADCEAKCLSSARSMIELFDTTMGLGPEIVIMDLDLAVIAYQCARILVYCFRNIQASLTRGETEKSLNICKELLSRRFCESDAVSEIRDDLVSLMSHCFSLNPISESLNEGQVSSSTGSSTEESPHILSKHSLIRQMDLERREQSNLRPLEALKSYEEDPARQHSYQAESSIPAMQSVESMNVYTSHETSGRPLITSSESAPVFLGSPKGLNSFDPLLFDLSLPDFDVGSASWIVSDNGRA